MRLGLRAKILLIAVAITLLSLGAVLAISSHIFAEAYLSALQSRSDAIAQSLRLQLERILQLGIQLENLSGFDKQCKTVTDAYPGVDFAWIASPNGTILFSSDALRDDRLIDDRNLLDAVGKRNATTVEYTLDGRTGYGSVLPILSRDDTHVGSVVIGLSASVLKDKERDMRTAVVGVGLLALVLGAILLVAVLSRFISRPLRRLIGSIERIGSNTTDLGQRVALDTPDELGTLARSFNRLMQSLQDTTVSKSSLEAAYAELERYRNRLEDLVKERTHELRDRTEQLDAIFSLSPDGFVSFDTARRVRFANQAFLHMTGMTADEVIGLDERAFSLRLQQRSVTGSAFPDIAALHALQAHHPTDAAPGEERRRQFELAEPVRRIIEVDLRIPAAAVNVAQILYFRDVTRETEVDRMKSEFLSHAAHELRTPMASIYGYAELLLAQEFDAETRREMLTTIYSQAELITSITNELLDLARIEARRGKDFVIERISLAEVVGDAVKGYKLPTGRMPPLLDLPDAPQFIAADRKKMQQAVLNVVSNAYKYSPNGGDVTIVIRRSAVEGAVWKGMVGVEVRDHGLGMTPEQLSHVFERFYRADTSGKIPGSGLGMSIVKEIIELHGGMIDLVSEFGVGTTVTLWLPLMADLH